MEGSSKTAGDSQLIGHGKAIDQKPTSRAATEEKMAEIDYTHRQTHTDTLDKNISSGSNKKSPIRGR